MRRVLIITAVTILLLLLMTAEAEANPYSLYDHGNCVRFTYDCIDIYWDQRYV